MGVLWFSLQRYHIHNWIYHLRNAVNLTFWKIGWLYNYWIHVLWKTFMNILKFSCVCLCCVCVCAGALGHIISAWGTMWCQRLKQGQLYAGKTPIAPQVKNVLEFFKYFTALYRLVWFHSDILTGELFNTFLRGLFYPKESREPFLRQPIMWSEPQWTYAS